MYSAHLSRSRRTFTRRGWLRRGRTLTTVASALCTVALLLVAPSAGTAQAARTTGGSRPIYLDPHAPISARVNDLLARMTLAEKIGQ
ncbi:MAG TPA: hypothetical protein VFX70_15280, partial [Mycobacteriales bacterium]|nr:hypothetical protein [Mycobacteriales bacterium]